jgi:uncharacterized surface protein with fasciclin (FAS1) repeats
MNMRLLKNIFFLVLPLLAGAVSLTGCDNDDDAVAVDNIDTLLSKNGNLGIFKAALQKTGLITYAKGGGPFTFFAPSDAAFKASGINSPADLNAIDENVLARVLAYHIMNGRRTFVEIPAGPNAPATTVGTQPLYASKNGTVGYINGAMISQSDIIATNGVIHVIERVLVPPVGNTLITLQANPDFKLLVQGITKAGLSGTFTAATPVYTVMAPTNAAFVAAGFDSTAIANLSGTALTNFTNILRYHLVVGRLFSSEFRDGTLKTLQGTGLPITVSGGPKVKGPANPAAINITATDWPTSNGLIQTIGGVLRY